MPKAKRVHSTPRKTAPIASRAREITQPANLPQAPNIASLPDVYSLILDGDCMQPLVPDRAAVVLQKSATFAAGDVVCIWFQPGIIKPGMARCWLKRLTMNIPPWVKFPYKDHPKSDVRALGFFEQLHPPRNYSLACEHILAIHKAIGFVPPGSFAKSTSLDQMIRLPGAVAP